MVYKIDIKILKFIFLIIVIFKKLKGVSIFCSVYHSVYSVPTYSAVAAADVVARMKQKKKKHNAKVRRRR